MSLIVLIGPPGALLDEVAGELSKRMGRPFLTTTSIAEQVTGETLDDFAIDHSEDRVRALERDIALACLVDIAAADDRILALGSGSLGNNLDDEFFASVRERLAELATNGARVLWLTADLTHLVKRNGLGGPRMAAVSSPRRIFYQQLTQRAPLYEALSEERINTSHRTVEESADLVEQYLGGSGPHA
ncbi:hypothetical protein I6E29_04120 [Arcanobacterium haemolyticum]|nr:hypothetical protein [Arcanobacterium haemolyticum]